MRKSNLLISNLRYNPNDSRLLEINETRKKAGLPPIEQKKRNCLLCEKEFLSTGSNDRRCEQCRNSKKLKRNKLHDF